MNLTSDNHRHLRKRIHAMTTGMHEIDRVVLEAVSDDYQSFESVVRKLSRAQAGAWALMDVERVLLISIAHNLVAAYLIHADPPYATEVGADSSNIRTYWFCITEEGRRHLGRLAHTQNQASCSGRPRN
jgi:hypothetical protein